MKEYFDTDGHLTDFALQELISGEPDELARLEIAEHLSFCDRCTDRYTTLLCGEDLLVPPEPVAPNVLQRIRQRARVVFLNRYVAAGVAACFALVLWFSGAFTPKLEARDPQALERIASISGNISDRTVEFGDELSNRINGFFDNLSSFDLKGVFKNEKK